jgi:hypothetical protein
MVSMLLFPVAHPCFSARSMHENLIELIHLFVLYLELDQEWCCHLLPLLLSGSGRIASQSVDPDLLVLGTLRM